MDHAGFAESILAFFSPVSNRPLSETRPYPPVDILERGPRGVEMAFHVLYGKWHARAGQKPPTPPPPALPLYFRENDRKLLARRIHILIAYTYTYKVGVYISYMYVYESEKPIHFCVNMYATYRVGVKSYTWYFECSYFLICMMKFSKNKKNNFYIEEIFDRDTRRYSADWWLKKKLQNFWFNKFKRRLFNFFSKCR